MVCGKTINKSKVVIHRVIQDRGYLQDAEKLSSPLREKDVMAASDKHLISI